MEAGAVNLTGILDAYRSGEIKPSEAAADLFPYIKEKNAALRAYLRVYEDEAMAAALAADRAYAEGAARPLEGALIAVKDNQTIKGKLTTAASKMLEGYAAPYTATAVQKLLDAGAIVVGQTNQDEFAMGSSTENSAFGPTRNPADESCVPGGSSGGSAAAVAADMCHAALGSDTGGSIRQPAALCGCVGFKPTYGSVSRYGLLAMASSLDVIGPMTATVSDAKIVYNTIRGRDPRDATSRDLAGRKQLRPGDSLKGVRIGMPREYFMPGIEGAVEEGIQQAIQKLKFLGAEVRDISLPHAEYGLATYYVIMPAEASTNLSRYDGVRYPASAMPQSPSLVEGYVRSRAAFGPEVQRRILIGTYVLSAGYYDAYYRQAQKARSLLAKDFNEAWREVDLIVSPTSPTLAWKIGEKTQDPLSMYLSDIFTVTANLVGVPAISVPAPTSDLPVGLQIMAPRDEDLFLLDAAGVFENCC
jgi:aspartyl-tRNA(Asn)/glutamyl-tRNA(Gln) amidotransferase subunit A